MRNAQRKIEDDTDEDNEKLKIFDQDIQLDNLDIHYLEEPRFDLGKDFLLNEIEVL